MRLLFLAFLILVGFDSGPLSAAWLSSYTSLDGIPTRAVRSCSSSPCAGSTPLPGTSLTVNYDAHGTPAFGVLKSYAAISLSSGTATPGGHDWISLQGDSSFADVFTFAGGGAGSGTVQFSFSLSGAISTVPTHAIGDESGNQGEAFVYAYLPSSNTIYYIAEVNSTNPLSARIPVTFGQPIDIEFHLTSVARLYEFQQAGSSVLSDFSHTAILNGISVFDFNGNPMPVVVTAQSGMQYGPNGVAVDSQNYTIPGTNLQIAFYNSTDPQYRLSNDEINRILNTLSLYPRSQLAHLKVVQVLPSSQPDSPYPSTSAITTDTVLLYVPNLETRTNSPPPGMSGEAGPAYWDVDGALGMLTWNNLTTTQVQEWDSIGQGSFSPYYSGWVVGSQVLGSTHNAGTGTSTFNSSGFFMAALFTDWQTGLIYLYTPPPGSNSGPGQMTTSPVTLTPTLWAFGNYQLFLSGTNVIGYQTGTAQPVYWGEGSNQPLLPLPSMVASHLSTLSASCTPTALAFAWALGTTAPANETCSVASSLSGIGVTATAATALGGNWLQVSLKPATSPSALTVSVEPAGLAVGPYNGTITLSALQATNVVIPVTLVVGLGPNTQLKAVSGDGQTGAAGTGQLLPNPLVVQVTGDGGAPFAGVPVVFAVTSGSAGVSVYPGSSVFTGSDGTARVSVVFNSQPGGVTVTATVAGLPSIQFHLVAFGPNTQLKAAGGDGQTGAAGQALSSPLVVQVTSSGGAPLAGVPVAFAVTSGAATLSASSVFTGSDGTARVTVTLGSSPGGVTVTATVVGLPSIQFHLTAVGPTIATGGVVNAASDQPLLAPGALATVYGANFSPPATVFTNDVGNGSAVVRVGLFPGTSNNYALGCNFVVPAGSDLIFTGGSYLASFVSGTNSVNVALYTDSGGKPGSLLESINLVNALTSSAAAVPFSSAASPTLLAGQQYWLAVSMANPSTSTSYWWFPSKTDPGLTVQSLNGGPWGANSSNRLGFTILASPKAAGLPLPTSLGGVTVSLGGRAAPLLYVGPSQINFQVPYETPPGTSAVVVTANRVAGGSASVSVAAAAPGIFVYGNDWAVVLNQDYSLNGPSNPAKAGSYVMLYGTGAGAVSPAVPTGSAAPALPLSTVTNVTATINGVPATVTFQGLAPNFVGLLQVNMQVPALPTGSYLIQITAGGVKSNSASIAVVP